MKPTKGGQGPNRAEAASGKRKGHVASALRGLAVLLMFLWIEAIQGGLAVEPHSKIKVFFGGFAFCFDATEITNRYPIAAELNRATVANTPFIAWQVRDFFQQHRAHVSGIDLQFDLVRTDDTPLVLALGMTQEQVLQEDLGSFHKLVLQLGFELLVLDFRGKEVISSQPIIIEFRDAATKRFETAQIIERVRQMVEGPQSQLFAVIAAKCSQISIGGKNQATLRLQQVALGESIPPFLPAAFRQDTELFAQMVAQQFGDLLSNRAGLSLLPFRKDALNTGRMALAFVDGNMVQFTIPAPTYAIDLNVRELRKVLQEKRPADASWIYGAFLDVRIYEPTFQKTFFHASFTNGAAKVVPASQRTVDEFLVVSDVLKGTFLKAIDGVQKDKRTQLIIKQCKL